MLRLEFSNCKCDIQGAWKILGLFFVQKVFDIIEGILYIQLGSFIETFNSNFYVPQGFPPEPSLATDSRLRGPLHYSSQRTAVLYKYEDTLEFNIL